MYYTSRVKPDIVDTNISSIRDQIEQKFKAESSEIRDEVMRIHNDQKAKSVAEDEGAPIDAKTCARCVFMSITHQQNTLFWTVLDRATQIPRAHSLVHSGQVCPDTHSLLVPVQLCPDTHSYELLSSSGQYNPNSSIILPFITRLS